jgi:hypothetical protein
MDRLREQFSRKSGLRRDVSSDGALKTSVIALSSPEQPAQIQVTAEDEDLYGLKELWPDELRGFKTNIEWVPSPLCLEIPTTFPDILELVSSLSMALMDT